MRAKAAIRSSPYDPQRRAASGLGEQVTDPALRVPLLGLGRSLGDLPRASKRAGFVVMKGPPEIGRRGDCEGLRGLTGHCGEKRAAPQARRPRGTFARRQRESGSAGQSRPAQRIMSASALRIDSLGMPNSPP